MFVIGLVLIVLGAVAIIGAVTSSEGTVNVVGFDDLTALTMFLAGLASGVAILLGLAIMRFAARRSMKHRREQKKLAELSDQLDRVHQDRRHDQDEDRPTI